MSNTLRSRLALLIHEHGTSARSVVNNLNKVVGDAGEEALAAAMVGEKMGFNADNILGYSNTPGVPNRFGLSNKSHHGLDMLVYAPPPSSLEVRIPTPELHGIRNGRNGIDGAHPADTMTMVFEERTLLVIETKTTLGGIETPGLRRTQRTGAAKIEDISRKIERTRQGWTQKKMAEVDPDFQKKLDAIEDAKKTGAIKHLHAQIFFDSQGQLNPLVGGGSGIQLNIW